jgi:hypothetical protein
MDNFGSASLGLQGIGGILAMIGAYSSAQGQKSNLRFQAHMSDINADTAERSAQAALLLASTKSSAARSRRRT